MSLTKSTSLTVAGYNSKLSSELKFYQGDSVKLLISLNEFGVNVNTNSKAIMPINPLNAKMIIDNPTVNDTIETCNIIDNKIEFVLTKLHTQHVGVTKVMIVLSDNDGCEITIPEFSFEVKERLSINTEALKVAKVDEGEVGKCIVGEETTYNLNLNWVTGEIITSSKLNAMVKSINDNKIAIENIEVGGGSGLTPAQIENINKVPQIETDLETITSDFNNHIANHPSGEGSSMPNLSGVLLQNANSHLDIETYDGSNQLVHTKVLYFKNSWNGYKFWMAGTPLPYYPSIDEYKENPSIWCSNNGEKWIIPTGLSNPIDEVDTSFYNYNSDTHLVYIESTNTLECWYRHWSGGTETIYKKTSTDGIKWSDKKQIMQKVATNKELLSPVVIHEEGKYKLWFVDGNNKTLPYFESEDGINFLKVKDIIVSNKDIWHIDIIKSNNKYLLVSNVVDLQTCVYSESFDGIEWGDFSTILKTSGKETNKWDSENLYRPSLTEVDGSYYFYYTGRDDDKTGAKQGLIKIGKQGEISANDIVETENKRFISSSQLLSVKNSEDSIKALILAVETLKEKISNLENGNSFDEITNFSFTPTHHTFTNKEETLIPNAIFIPNLNIDKTLKWTSSNETVATVNQFGIISPVKNGICEVTATTVNNKSYSCNITVNLEGESAVDFDTYIIDGTEGYKVENWANHGSSASTSVFSIITPSEIKGYSTSMWDKPEWVSLLDDVRVNNFSKINGTTTNYLSSTFHDDAISVREDSIFIEIKNDKLTTMDIQGIKNYFKANNVRIDYRINKDNKHYFRITKDSIFNIPGWGVTSSCIWLEVKMEVSTYADYLDSNVFVKCNDVIFDKIENPNTEPNKNLINKFSIFDFNGNKYLNISIDKSLIDSYDLTGVKKFLEHSPVEFSF